MLTKEQEELKGMVDAAEEVAIINAINAGCIAADIHLTCSYPECKCKHLPVAIRAAIAAYMLRLTIAE